jgi:hypothetical protein
VAVYTGPILHTNRRTIPGMICIQRSQGYSYPSDTNYNCMSTHNGINQLKFKLLTTFGSKSYKVAIRKHNFMCRRPLSGSTWHSGISVIEVTIVSRCDGVTPIVGCRAELRGCPPLFQQKKWYISLPLQKVSYKVENQPKSAKKLQ